MLPLIQDLRAAISATWHGKKRKVDGASRRILIECDLTDGNEGVRAGWLVLSDDARPSWCQVELAVTGRAIGTIEDHKGGVRYEELPSDAWPASRSVKLELSKREAGELLDALDKALAP